MLPTRATVAASPVFAKLLDITLPPPITGIRLCGKPSTSAPTVAEAPGVASVPEGDWEVAAGAVDDPVEVGPVLAEESGEAGLQAAKASRAPAARAARPWGWGNPKSFKGFLRDRAPVSLSSLVRAAA
jgi:hypothetical protein